MKTEVDISSALWAVFHAESWGEKEIVTYFVAQTWEDLFRSIAHYGIDIEEVVGIRLVANPESGPDIVFDATPSDVKSPVDFGAA